MSYHCKDCSYRGKVSGKAGECPACGSFNLTIRDGGESDQPEPKKWRLVLVFVLWGYFLVHIIWKLLS